ncbi:condensation domain-containing protein [Streptomyces sp. NBC_01483]|uniref:condensation domain-containing protein n=1 Tax=Streptomyces sp. NBC_01483 TaxID=2903883 RepID=UPI002E2EAE8B|nr:condensation domain-containing protein [Streptomyces sp. NBC_01483]
MGRDVAIIGMAVRMPEADDLSQFLANLQDGRDGVRELSPERRGRTSLSSDAQYQLNGYIEDIDSFDHEVFGISPGEARNMAPEHRLLLQCVYQALENAGYDPASLDGTRTSVYVGDTRLDYQQLARQVEPTMVMGTHASATAGRIARFFGLRGPAAMVDSSCSSAMLAVHQGVNDLLLGDADLALVCGVNLNLLGEPKDGEDELDLGIRSADGKTRTFSADANGTGSGEAVVSVLLKPLDRALRDADVIHAVIKGIAANNVAGRSSSLTAPDSSAQAEVIGQAWTKAGIDPTTISYIEAHGTATRLGDPIEIEAIDLAFSRVTDRKQFCAVSSVKSNIGHTWSASGLAGLVKAVLALRNRQLFPSLHVQTLSPLIDFANSAVTVTRELTPWEPAVGVRRAGVSAFGVMGTNVHAVLEEAPVREEPDPSRNVGSWIPVSAKTSTALVANIDALRSWLVEHPDLRIEDVQRTLVAGRLHSQYRACVTAADMAGLTAALAAPAMAGPESSAAVTVILLSGRCTASASLTASLRDAHPEFDRLYAQVEQAAGARAEHPRVGQFAFQYAMYGLLGRIGVESRHVVGEGIGKLVIDASVGRTDLAEAVQLAVSAEDANAADLDSRVDRLLATLGDQRVLFVEAGLMSTISAAIAGRSGIAHSVVALTERPDAFAALLRDLYLAGARWRWAETAGDGRRIELPAYQFDRTRCWLDPANTVAPAPQTEDPAPADSAEATRHTDVLGSVLAAWQGVLGIEAIGPEESFFDLGGDSIGATQVLNRLQKVHGVELDTFAIFDHETPAELAAYIEKVAGNSTFDTTKSAVESTPPRLDAVPTSADQLNVWLAAEFAGGSVAFNLIRSFELTGTVNIEALRRALDALAARHDALRATFSYAGEELTQRITPAAGYTVPLELLLDEDVHGAADSATLARAYASRPFDLGKGPLLRAQLASIGADRHLLTLCTHHVVVDGWSLGLLVRDLGAYYAFFDRGVALDLPEIGIDYSEHYRKLAQQVGGRHNDAAAYWLDKFQTPVPPLDLPTPPAEEDLPSYSGAYRHYSLPVPLWLRLKSFCQATGVTVFTAMLSAVAAALHGYSRDGDLVIGTLIAGRHSESLEQLVAMLIRSLPLRLQVDADGSFEQLSETVRATFVDALRNSDYPYEELVEELQQRGLLQASGLFDVIVAFQQFGESGEASLSALAGPDLAVRPIEVNLDTRDVPINIMLAEEAGRMRSAIRYDSRRFNADMMDRLWADISRLLDRALDDPSAPLHLAAGPIDGDDGKTAQPTTAPTPVGEQGPHNACAETLTGIWCEVLGVSDFTVTDRFFDIGGNSLRAIKVLARIQSRLGVTLDLGTFFARPTIAGLADALAEVQQQAVAPIPSLGGPGDYDGARTQDLLMEIDRGSAHPGAFHRNDLHELRGPVDPELLKHSFELLVERHESMRTTCDMVGGRTVQTVHAPGVLPLNYHFHDMTGSSADQVHEFVIVRKDEPFETARDPLVRADLIRLSVDTYLLLTSIHHVFADGSSAKVLYRDWRELYEALVAGRAADLPELSIQYKDAAAWRNGRLTSEVRSGHQEFWRQELSGLPLPVPVPADLPRPEVSALDGARLYLPLPTDLAERFGALARRHSVTEFTVGFCAVGLLLATTGVTNSLIGTYSLGRDRQEFEDQIGSFINTVPLRFRVTAGDEVPALLAQAQQTILRAFEHDEYPYGETMRDLGWQRGTDRSPLFDVVVNLDQMESGWHAAPLGASISFVPKDIPRRAKQADLQFVFQRSADGLVLAMSYNTEIFSPNRAHGILQRLQAVLDGMATALPISEILTQEDFPHD